MKLKLIDWMYNCAQIHFTNPSLGLRHAKWIYKHFGSVNKHLSETIKIKATITKIVPFIIPYVVYCFVVLVCR